VRCIRGEQDEKEISALAEFAAALGKKFVKLRGAKATSTSAAFNQTLTAQCDFAWSRCRQVLACLGSLCALFACFSLLLTVN